MKPATRRSALSHLAIASITGIAITTGLACAHGGATGIVKERMDQMGEVAKSMKAIGAMLKGASPYDAGQLRHLATEIGNRGGSHLTMLFPEGSLMKPTEAVPQIWTSWDRFAELAEDMAQKAGALAETGVQASEMPEATKAAFRELAGTCKACHEAYRIKKQ